MLSHGSFFLWPSSPVLRRCGQVESRAEDTLDLDELVAEGVAKSPEILAAQARAAGSGLSDTPGEEPA